MSKTIKLVVLMAVIASCIAWLTYWNANEPEPGEPMAIPLPTCCASCNAAYVYSLGKQPTKCQKCGKVDAWRAMQCVKCKAFVPLINDPEGPNKRPSGKCPKCGGAQLTENISPNDIKPP